MMIGDQTPQVRDEDGAFSRQDPAFELHRSIALFARFLPPPPASAGAGRDRLGQSPSEGGGRVIGPRTNVLPAALAEPR